MRSADVLIDCSFFRLGLLGVCMQGDRASSRSRGAAGTGLGGCVIDELHLMELMSCIIPPQRFLPPGGDVPTGLLGQVQRRAECRGRARKPLPFCSEKPAPLQRRGKKKTLSLAGCVCSEADLLTPGRACSRKGRAAHIPRERPRRQGNASGEGPQLVPHHEAEGWEEPA